MASGKGESLKAFCVIDLLDATTTFETRKNVEIARQVLNTRKGWEHIDISSLGALTPTLSLKALEAYELIVLYFPNPLTYAKHSLELTTLSPDVPCVVVVEGHVNTNLQISTVSAAASELEGSLLLTILTEVSKQNSQLTIATVANSFPHIFRFAGCHIKAKAHFAATRVPWMEKVPELPLLEWSVIASLPCWQREVAKGPNGSLQAPTYFSTTSKAKGYTPEDIVVGLLHLVPECRVKVLEQRALEYRAELAEGALGPAVEQTIATLLVGLLRQSLLDAQEKNGLHNNSYQIAATSIGSGILSINVSADVPPAIVLGALATLPAIPLPANADDSFVPIVFVSQCFVARLTGTCHALCLLEEHMRRDTDASTLRLEDVILNDNNGGGVVNNEPNLVSPATPIDKRDTQVFFNLEASSSAMPQQDTSPSTLPTPPSRPQASALSSKPSSNPLSHLNNFSATTVITEFDSKQVAGTLSQQQQKTGLDSQSSTVSIDYVKSLLREQQLAFERRLAQQNFEIRAEIGKAVSEALKKEGIERQTIIQNSAASESIRVETRIANLEQIVRETKALCDRTTAKAMEAIEKIEHLAQDTSAATSIQKNEVHNMLQIERESILKEVTKLIERQNTSSTHPLTADSNTSLPANENLQQLIATECHKLFQPLATNLATNYHTKSQFQETATGIVARIPTKDAVTALVAAKVDPVEDALKKLAMQLASEMESLRTDFAAKMDGAKNDGQAQLRLAISTNNKQFSEERLREMTKERDAMRKEIAETIKSEISRLIPENSKQIASTSPTDTITPLQSEVTELRQKLENRTEILKNRVEELTTRFEGIAAAAERQRSPSTKGRESSVINGVASTIPLTTVIVATPPPPPRASTPPPEPLLLATNPLSSTSLGHPYQRRLSFDSSMTTNGRMFASKGLVDAQYAEMRRAITSLQGTIHREVADKLKGMELQLQSSITNRFTEYDRYQQAEHKALDHNNQLRLMQAKENIESALEYLRVECAKIRGDQQSINTRLSDALVTFDSKSAFMPRDSPPMATRERRSITQESISPRWNTPIKEVGQMVPYPSDEVGLLSPRYEEMQLLKSYSQRLSSDLKTLKQRIDAVELAQADLTPLLANEDQHLRALSTMLSRLQRLEQQMLPAAQQRSTSASPPVIDRRVLQPTTVSRSTSSFRQ